VKKIITCDFDDTLAITGNGAWGGETLTPISRVINYLFDQHKKGSEIHIVTFRNWSNKEQVNDFCKGYKIPIKSIVCTEGTNKVPFLKQLKSELHIDDSVEVCTLCVMAKIDVLLVDWGQDKHNTTATFLPKI
jgi:uncharacterized HAD superfamily protein